MATKGFIISVHKRAHPLPDRHPFTLSRSSTAIVPACQRMPVLHMFFEACPEILSTLEAHYNRGDQEQHGKCTEDSKHASCWFIRCCCFAHKDLAEFVHEISDRDDVRHDDTYLAFATLMLHNPCCKYEQCCCERNSGDRKIELCLPNWQSLRTSGYC